MDIHIHLPTWWPWAAGAGAVVGVPCLLFWLFARALAKGGL